MMSISRMKSNKKSGQPFGDLSLKSEINTCCSIVEDCLCLVKIILEVNLYREFCEDALVLYNWQERQSIFFLVNDDTLYILTLQILFHFICVDICNIPIYSRNYKI